MHRGVLGVVVESCVELRDLRRPDLLVLDCLVLIRFNVIHLYVLQVELLSGLFLMSVLRLLKPRPFLLHDYPEFVCPHLLPLVVYALCQVLPEVALYQQGLVPEFEAIQEYGRASVILVEFVHAPDHVEARAEHAKYED